MNDIKVMLKTQSDQNKLQSWSFTGKHCRSRVRKGSADAGVQHRPVSEMQTVYLQHGRECGGAGEGDDEAEARVPEGRRGRGSEGDRIHREESDQIKLRHRPVTCIEVETG